MLLGASAGAKYLEQTSSLKRRRGCTVGIRLPAKHRSLPGTGKTGQGRAAQRRIVGVPAERAGADPVPVAYYEK